MKGVDITMKQDLGLCFKLARENADLTQEYAAELLNVSITTIGNYERNIVKKHDEDLVAQMIKIYNAKWLGYMYMQKSKVGSMILPKIELCDPAAGVLHFQKETRDLTSIEYDLIDIASDGRIDISEIPRWKNSIKEVMDVCASGFALTLCAE